MVATRTCSKCGSEFSGSALQGLCPSCVGRLAFVSEPEASAGAVKVPRPSGTKLRYFGDYELLEEVARGGMGVVYKARQLSLNRIVAVKMILSGKLASTADVARFRAEAEAAANLRHPNIVAIHEVGEQDGQHYFSMDYVEGKSLAELVAGHPLPSDGRGIKDEGWFRRVAGWVKTIAEAIHYAHGQGTLHRDLKPSNVLIDSSDHPHITDFGLAKRVKHDSDLTVSGQILGTPNFMSPEQAAGKRGGASPQSDVYSLGAMLYFLLTGKPPHAGETVHETLAKVLGSEPAAPRALNRNLPRDLETICLKCLEKEPRSRYASAKELADELGRFLSNQPILARPASRVEKAWRSCRRNPVVATLALSLAISLAAFLIVLSRPKVTPSASLGDVPTPQMATRPSSHYDGPVPTIIALDGTTLNQTIFGPGQGVAIDSKNNNLWCGMLVSNAVVIRDGTTGSVITNLTLADCPGAVTFDPVHRLAWVAAQCGLSHNKKYRSNDLLWAVDADTFTVVGTVMCGGVNASPEFVNPRTGRFYHVVNGPQRVVAGEFIPTTPAFGWVQAVNPDANLLYAVDRSGSLQIIDGAPDPEKILTSIPLSLGNPATCHIAVSTSHNRLYVGDATSGKIAILDASTGTNCGSLILDAGVGEITRVWGLAVDDSRNRLFVAAGRADQTACLIAVQGTNQHAICFPSGNMGLTVNPAINKVYVWANLPPATGSVRK